ncbi:MAG TPA: hypothetical protein VKB65_12165 [Myxococcota bacterium]|nr:hypothetical protein [Myxococcota bacterium]
MERKALTGAAIAALLTTGGLLGGEDAVVRAAQPAGPYLQVRLGGGSDVEVLVPATPVCTRLAKPEARVHWVSRGFPGRLESGDEACEAAGIFDLAAWRDRRPRPGGPPLPRKTARWSVIHRDGRLALLRGRFELAGLVGMAGGRDIVAVIADDPRCAGLLEASEGALEYRDSGPDAFRLLSGDAHCPVLGFARPLPPGGAAPAP